jgi:hypothetical protein
VKGNAIKQVTNALYERLVTALSDSKVPGTVFLGPLNDPSASGAALILFLYRIEPSAALRNCEHRVVAEKPPSVVQVFQNSLPLNLYFLITVGATQPTSAEDALLGALGYVMQSLQMDPDLIGSEVDHETVRVSLEPLSTEEISRIWALFPTANYRTSVAYVATPAWIDPPDLDPGAPPVLQDQLNAGPRISPASGASMQ